MMMENCIGKICPFCKTEITAEDEVKVCPVCEIPHHEACWNENGGCTTFGCSGDTQLPSAASSAVCTVCNTPLAENQVFCHVCGSQNAGAIKNFCAKCGEELQDGQVFCPNCGRKAGSKKKPAKEKKPLSPKKKKAIIGISIGTFVVAVGLVLGLYVVPTFVMPKLNIYLAEKAFAAQEYTKAADRYERSGLQADALYAGKHAYANGMVQMAEGSYEAAATSFSQSGELLDSVDKIFECGTLLLEAEDYAGAANCFALSNTDEAVAHKKYADGMVSYLDKGYSNAIILFQSIDHLVPEAAEILPQVYFEYGLELFNDKNYKEAKSKFQLAKNHPEAANYANASTLLLAEQKMQNGYLNEAKTLLSTLSQDYTYSGINAGERLKNLNNLAPFLAICGKWTATSNYIETRNVYKRSGSWDSWYYDNENVFTSQTLDLKCHYNADGTITIDGTVSFEAFTDYSSLSVYNRVSTKTRYFKISNIKSIPSSYRIDDYTTLKYANGVFNIAYSYRDNYSTSFYNLYTSNVTYGKNSTKY